MTRSIRNRLGLNSVDTDTRYETSIESIKTQWTRPSSQDDSVKIRKLNPSVRRTKKTEKKFQLSEIPMKIQNTRD